MTGPRHRRGRRRIGAGLIVLSLGATACADEQPVAQRTTATTLAPGVVPVDHGLSAALVADVLPSTVGISGVACGRLANGSGFAIADNLIVTNAHVILGIEDIRVHTFDERELRGIPVAFDADADLAVLEVKDAGLVPLALASDAADGSIGLLAGWEAAPFPDPTPYRIERGVIVRIETVGGSARVERRSWLLTADLDLGDSGAALIDTSGDVVGIAFATSKEGDGVGYAVRASEVDVLISRGFDPNLTIPPC